MAVEAIQKVTELEQNVKKQRESAAMESKQRLLEAQRAARRLEEESRQEAERQARDMMKEAEAQAAKWTQSVLDQARQDCEARKREARTRLDQAAAFLVEKVVNH